MSRARLAAITSPEHQSSVPDNGEVTRLSEVPSASRASPQGAPVATTTGERALIDRRASRVTADVGDCTVALTKGAIETICNTMPPVDTSSKPTLQIVGVNTFDTDDNPLQIMKFHIDGKANVYGIKLSDGVHFMQVVLAPHLSAMVDRGQ
eukprot:6484002-Prymnesium_polylepis.1